MASKWRAALSHWIDRDGHQARREWRAEFERVDGSGSRPRYTLFSLGPL